MNTERILDYPSSFYIFDEPSAQPPYRGCLDDETSTSVLDVLTSGIIDCNMEHYTSDSFETTYTPSSIPLDVFAQHCARLRDIFEFRSESVFSFLLENQFLMDLLFEVAVTLRELFSTPALFLDIFDDPTNSDNPVLVVRIRPQEPPEQALQAEQRFDVQWWTPNHHRSRGKMMITTNYAI